MTEQKKDFISQVPLQLGMSMWLTSGQSNMSKSSVYKIWSLSLKEMYGPPRGVALTLLAHMEEHHTLRKAEPEDRRRQMPDTRSTEHRTARGR